MQLQFIALKLTDAINEIHINLDGTLAVVTSAINKNTNNPINLSTDSLLALTKALALVSLPLLA